jgi:Family of unknown function (DUF6982)
MLQKVVAHFIDHSVIKGTSADVDPKRPVCHVHTPAREVVEVDMRQVKALFFVKDLDGKPGYHETQAPADGDQRLRGSRQVEVAFADGERLGGLMNRFPPLGPFFFMLPIDPQSNNVRILVNRDAVATMRPVDGQGNAAAPRESQPQRISLSEAPARPKRTSWVFDGKDIKQVPTE